MHFDYCLSTVHYDVVVFNMLKRCVKNVYDPPKMARLLGPPLLIPRKCSIGHFLELENIATFVTSDENQMKVY